MVRKGFTLCSCSIRVNWLINCVWNDGLLLNRVLVIQVKNWLVLGRFNLLNALFDVFWLFIVKWLCPSIGKEIRFLDTLGWWLFLDHIFNLDALHRICNLNTILLFLMKLIKQCSISSTLRSPSLSQQIWGNKILIKKLLSSTNDLFWIISIHLSWFWLFWLFYFFFLRFLQRNYCSWRNYSLSLIHLL